MTVPGGLQDAHCVLGNRTEGALRVGGFAGCEVTRWRAVVNLLSSGRLHVRAKGRLSPVGWLATIWPFVWKVGGG